MFPCPEYVPAGMNPPFGRVIAAETVRVNVVLSYPIRSALISSTFRKFSSAPIPPPLKLLAFSPVIVGQMQIAVTHKELGSVFALAGKEISNIAADRMIVVIFIAAPPARQSKSFRIGA